MSGGGGERLTGLVETFEASAVLQDIFMKEEGRSWRKIQLIHADLKGELQKDNARIRGIHKHAVGVEMVSLLLLLG